MKNNSNTQENVKEILTGLERALGILNTLEPRDLTLLQCFDMRREVELLKEKIFELTQRIGDGT